MDDYERDHHQEWKDSIAQGIHDEHGNPIDPEPPDDEPTLAELLAATAEGTFGEEAAVWLLDQHSHWLPELERCGLIRELSWAGRGNAVVIAGPVESSSGVIGTDSEWQVLNVAWALYRGEPASLGNLASLDERNRRLVLHAVAWAAGGRDWADSLRLLPATTGGWGGGPHGDPWSAESPF